MINLIKPKFWSKKISLVSLILLPISLLYFIIIFFKKSFTKVKKFKIPIVCVGNIYIGGTGKTPTTIHIAKELSKIKMKPAILRKFYEKHNDEYNLIKSEFKHLILNKNRIDALKSLEGSDFDIVILDDGLQDYRIKIDLKIVCFNHNQLIGNGFVLPSGPLREGLGALKNAGVVLINGDEDIEFEKKILNINDNLEIFYSSYEPINLNEFKNKKLFAIAGIANPENFFQILEKNNLEVEKKFIFPDHYKFSSNEMMEIIGEAERKNCQIIMTEKDYFKINHFNLDKVKYLKVTLKIYNQDKFLNKIKSLNNENY